MKKKFLGISMLMLTSFLTLGLTSCNDSSASEELYEHEQDLYSMSNGDSIGEKILDLALDGVKAGAKKGGKKLVTDFATWAIKGIAGELGFEFAKEPNYKKIVSERLESIDSNIKDLEGKIDWLTESFSDQQYLNSYKDFMKEYEKMNVVVKDLWRAYCNLEEELSDTESELTLAQKEQMLDQLCEDIRNNKKGLSDLDIKASEFATNFYGYTTSTTALSKYSIIYIVERFVNKGSAFLANRCTNFNEIISNPLTVLYQATNLSVLEYTRQLTKGGIKEVRLGHDNFMIAYTAKVDNSEVSYLNCKESERESFIENYKDDLGEEYEIYKVLPCKTLSHFNVELNQLDYRIRDINNKYDSVAILINEFLVDRYDDIDENFNQLYYDDGKVQKTKKHIRTVALGDVLNFIPSNALFAAMYSNFGNIKKDEFLKYAKVLDRSALSADDKGQPKSLTFKELYLKEKYIFPENNETNLLILGIEPNNDIKENWDPGIHWRYKNFVNIVCLDLNTKVADFNKNPTFTKVIYGAFCSYFKNTTGCETVVKEKWFWFETKDGSKDNILSAFKSESPEMRHGPYAKRIFYTIDGLSLNPEKQNLVYPHFSF